MNRGDQAVANHKKGYNCCQSVLAACTDLTPYTEEELVRFGAGFLGGMATTKGTCGALVGAQMIMGLQEYRGKQVPKKAKEICLAFEERCGAVICGDLKGVKTKKVLCPCDDCIRHAAEIIEEKYDR